LFGPYLPLKKYGFRVFVASCTIVQSGQMSIRAGYDQTQEIRKQNDANN